MLDKNEDTFFNEQKGVDQASADLIRMIDSFDKKMPNEIKAGRAVEGIVTRIGDEYLFVDIGAKNEAMLRKEELAGAGIKVGDKISAYIVSDTEGETILSKRLGGRNAAKQELFDAFKNKIPVQGKVTGVSKDGLMVKILGRRAFSYLSHIDIKFTDDVNQFLNKTLEFVITRITEGGRNIIVSRIPILEKEILQRLEELEKCVKTRSIVHGKIGRITDFGIFVDIGGIEGLVHISEISWEHLTDTKEIYSPGDEVECIVLKVERKEPIKNSKISLSIKQQYEDPWKTVPQRFSVGQSVKGKVVRITDFGAFVELIPGVDGLVHVSEMSWVKKVRHPSEIVSVGSMVDATVLGIDVEKRTISLSFKDISTDPWRDIESRFPVGSEVQGKVAKKSRYGFFVDLEEGVTGLMVYSNIAPDKKEAIKEGDIINVYIESVDRENRRISLSHGIKEPLPKTENIQEGGKDTKQAAAPVASTEFGAALFEALMKRKAS